jgi:hypothetical protein
LGGKVADWATFILVKEEEGLNKQKEEEEVGKKRW